MAISAQAKQLKKTLKEVGAKTCYGSDKISVRTERLDRGRCEFTGKRMYEYGDAVAFVALNSAQVASLDEEMHSARVFVGKLSSIVPNSNLCIVRY